MIVEPAAEGTAVGAGPETDPETALHDTVRLAELRRLRLLDTPAEAAFDRLAVLAARLLRAPVALISLVDEDRQFFKSCVGLPEPWRSERQTPLTHSVCQYVVGDGRPLVISDARVDPVLATNRAIPDLGVVAYAGVPIRTGSGQLLGSFCAIDSEPRGWTSDDIGVLQDLAEAVGDLIELRAGDLAGRERREVLSHVVAAQEAERARIAAGIHDGALQAIAAVSIRLQLLRRRFDGDTSALIDRLLSSVQAASDDLRRLLFDLRPAVLDHEGLGPALEAHLEDTCAPLDVAFAVYERLDTAIPPEARLTLFRIAQQAIANALAHAGPDRIEVTLARDGEEVEVTVVDDGVGFEPRASVPRPGHLGLVTMRERAESAGGRVEVVSRPGGGTTVRSRLPLGRYPDAGGEVAAARRMATTSSSAEQPLTT
jgi:signal transduction histidine kinase